MKNLKLMTIAALALTPIAAQAKLNIVVTLPDCAALVREIVGDKATVTTLAQGAEDPHFVTPRPSYTRTLNKADLLIDGGAELEIGWLPPLVSGARNRNINPGGPGRVSASAGIRLQGVRTGPVDRSQGDVHAAGNPHFLLDPLRGKAVAQNLARAVMRLDAGNASVYQQNLDAFIGRLDKKLIEWHETMTAHKGSALVTYHSNFDYFAERYGLRVVGQLEPKPGLPPTPGHVRKLVPKAKAEKVKLVVIGSFRSRRLADFLAKQSGATTIALPIMPTESGGAQDYIGWIDRLVSEFDKALK